MILTSSKFTKQKMEKMRFFVSESILGIPRYIFETEKIKETKIIKLESYFVGHAFNFLYNLTGFVTHLCTIEKSLVAKLL